MLQKYGKGERRGCTLQCSSREFQLLGFCFTASSNGKLLASLHLLRGSAFGTSAAQETPRREMYTSVTSSLQTYTHGGSRDQHSSPAFHNSLADRQTHNLELIE